MMVSGFDSRSSSGSGRDGKLSGSAFGNRGQLSDVTGPCKERSGPPGLLTAEAAGLTFIWSGAVAAIWYSVSGLVVDMSGPALVTSGLSAISVVRSGTPWAELAAILVLNLMSGKGMYLVSGLFDTQTT